MRIIKLNYYMSFSIIPKQVRYRIAGYSRGGTAAPAMRALKMQPLTARLLVLLAGV